MLTDDEKRRFPRMAIECPARFRVVGTNEASGAIVKDLSGGGVLLWIDREVEAGSQLSIVIEPLSKITPPLSAVVEVVRCYPLGTAEEGTFAVACSMKQILDEEE